MKSCDLHGLRFEEGKQKIIDMLNECLLTHDESIQIVHGYHQHAFKDYIQSPEFLKDMEDEGIYLERVKKVMNPGITEFKLDLPPQPQSVSNPADSTGMIIFRNRKKH